MNRSIRILLIHETPAVAAGLAQALKSGTQVHVELADDLDTGIRRAREEAFGMIFFSVVLADPRKGGVADVRRRFTPPVVFILPKAGPAAALGIDDWEWVAEPFSSADVQRAMGVRLKVQAQEQKIFSMQKKVRDEELFADKGRLAARAAQDFEKLLKQVGDGLVRLRESVSLDSRGHITALETAVSRAERLCHQLHGERLRGSPPESSGPAVVQIHKTAGAVLVVDDEESIRELSACVVRQAGWAVVTARDGEEALLRFQSEPGRFVAAVLDLSLPRLTGIEVIAGIRSLRPMLPVILITGHGDESLAHDPRLALSGMLRKPFSTDALKAALARCVRPEVCPV